MANREFPQIAGLQVHLDSMQLQQPSALVADNVILRTSGFVSYFNYTTHKWEIKNRKGTQFTAFTVGEQSYILGDKVMYRWNITSNTLTVHRIFDDTIKDKPHSKGRWSYAVFYNKVVLCNSSGYHYMFKVDKGSLVLQDKIKGLQSDLIAVNEFGNRLIYITNDLVGWSAIDHPEKILQSESADSGAQELSIISPTAIPMSVASSITGCYVFTNEGILGLINTRTNPNLKIASPFLFQVVGRHEYVALSARAIVENVQRSLMFVTRNGIYVIEGQQIKPINDDINAFITNSISTGLMSTNLTLLYDKDERLLVIQTGVGNVSYVLNLTSKQWTRCLHFTDNVFSLDYQGRTLVGFVNNLNRLCLRDSEKVTKTVNGTQLPSYDSWVNQDSAGKEVLHFYDDAVMGNTEKEVYEKVHGGWYGNSLSLAVPVINVKAGTIVVANRPLVGKDLDLSQGSGTLDLSYGKFYTTLDLSNQYLGVHEITVKEFLSYDSHIKTHSIVPYRASSVKNNSRIVVGYFKVDPSADQRRDLYVRQMSYTQLDTDNNSTRWIQSPTRIGEASLGKPLKPVASFAGSKSFNVNASNKYHALEITEGDDLTQPVSLNTIQITASLGAINYRIGK